MKHLFLLFFFFFFTLLLPSQVLQDSIHIQKKDSSALSSDDIGLDSSNATLVVDTLVPAKKEPVISAGELYNNILQRALKKSSFLNSSASVIEIISDEKISQNQEEIFYVLLGIMILLAFLKFFYNRYLSNLFQVFFNTSLRQSQLTDQLLQAKQASMFFNILFFLTAGVYTYFLLLHFNWINRTDDLPIILFCALGIAIVYFLKFVNMKFTGWLTGNNTAANTYLFIIFLINKILGILLIPFIIVIAFSGDYLKKPAVIISLLIVGTMFLLRFLRSFTLLHRQIKVSRLHFFLYIIGLEVLPVLLIYKGVMILLNKNL